MNLEPVKAIFTEAAAIASPEQRAAYLDHACAGDPDLRRQVEAFLELSGQDVDNLQAAAQIVAALVHHRTGDPETAREHLIKAEKAFRRMWPDPLEDSPPFLNDDTMRALILYREACTSQTRHGPFCAILRR
jgi:hypothetical protein